MNVIVVDCLTGSEGKRKFSRDFIGAGPRYIAGFIEEISGNAFKTDIIRGEMILNQSPVFLKKYSIIAVSAMTMDLLIVKKVLKKWNDLKNNKENLSILGGPIANKKSIIESLHVDVVFYGQAERSLKILFSVKKQKLRRFLLNSNDEILKEEIFKDIPNISFHHTQKENFTHNILELTFSDNEFFKNSSGYPNKIKDYQNFAFCRVYVELLRGCSNFRRVGLDLQNGKCSSSSCNHCRKEEFSTKEVCPENIRPGCGFCSTIAIFGSPQSRSIIKVIEEVRTLIRLGCRRIVLGAPDFLDFHRDVFSQDKLISPKEPVPNYKALKIFVQNLNAITEVQNETVQIFIENVKASLCTYESLKIMSTIPNAIFSIGCETGSKTFSNLLARPNPPLKVLNVLKIANELGIRAHVYFIHSLPGDRTEYAKETLELIKKIQKLNIEKFTLYKYRKLPKSPFSKVLRTYECFSQDYVKMIEKIKNLIRNYNFQKKKEMIGKTYRVYLSERNYVKKNDAIGWILQGGPKISVINGYKHIHNFKNVRIVHIISDKLIIGKIVKD